MSVVTKDMIFTYQAGQATVIQNRMILEWLLTPENIETYYEWVEEWEMQHAQYTPDLSIALQAFNQKIHAEKTATELSAVTPVLPASKIITRRIYFAAAAVVLLLFGSFILFNQKPSAEQYVTASGETKTITLSDSTIVTLGSGSTLKLSTTFQEKDRAVELFGQGIFNVKHTPDDRPFFVNTPTGMQVAVLGTAFDLFATRDSNRIYLSEGSVKLFLDKSKADSIKMQPGDLVKVNGGRNVQIKTAQSYWQLQALQNHTIVFNETSLAEITILMREQFGRTVVIRNEALADRLVSGSYKWTSVDEFMAALSEMMVFQVIKNGDEIIIK